MKSFVHINPHTAYRMKFSDKMIIPAMLTDLSAILFFVWEVE